jgi:Ca2+-binding EF-hand superfamily protein
MGDSDAGELIESLDANGNHLLDYEEFLAGTLRLQIHEHNSLLETILKKYDINDDGRIHIDDLRQVTTPRSNAGLVSGACSYPDSSNTPVQQLRK